MAEQDDAQKTEEPTHKKLEDSYKKGDVAKSVELKTWFMLLAGTILWGTSGPIVGDRIYVYFTQWLTSVHLIPLGSGGIESLVASSMLTMVGILIIPFSVLFLAALIGNMVQHRLIFTMEKIKPKLNKISPLSGLKRMFSSNTVFEFFKTTMKLLIVGAVAVIIVWPNRDYLDVLAGSPIQESLQLLNALGFRLLLGVTIVVAVIAAIDFVWQKYQKIKKLKMTKQEIKDEHKQTDGDPLIKARLRQVRMDRARQRMMAAVPNADVVLTNPTHFAVALEYKHGSMEVPKLIAKGVDDVAFRIRDVAEQNGIPIVENPPLTRALYAAVDLDEEVPPDQYKAVADVIGYVMKLRKAGVTPKGK